jgi:chloramphenicol-sensitive protein RarD
VNGEASQHRRGVGYAVAAYGLWGFLPLYFIVLDPASALEILGWRIIFSLVLCLVLVSATGHLISTFRLLRQRRMFWLSGGAGFLIAINWGVFIYATQNDGVVDAALGYFINPLVTALLGVVLLREKLRPLQWLALALGAVAVIVFIVGLGSVPLISLGVAFTFGTYGLLKKFMGRTGALEGLTIETLWIAPAAIGLVVWLGMNGELTLWTEGPLHAFLFGLIGVVTTVPLLLFTGAVRRIPLSTVGLLQYINPIMQALLGIFILNEAMPVVRWWGFAIVAIALIVFSWDAWKTRK